MADILLFTYTRFSSQKPARLTFAMIRAHSEWTDRARQSAESAKKGKNPSADPAKELLGRYGYMRTEDLDQILIDFVSNDVLDAERLSVFYAAYQQESATHDLSRAFRDIWKTLYHGTLRDNSQELCDRLQQVLEPYLPHITPSELDYALRTLTRLGRSGVAEKHFARFKEVRSAQFEQLDAQSQPHGNYEYVPLRRYLSSLARKSKEDHRTLEEVMDCVLKETSVSQRDAERLARTSIGALVTYFTTHDQPKLTSTLKLLASSGYDPLTRKATAAIRKIAGLNALNRLRLEGMGLVVPKGSKAKGSPKKT